MKKTIALVVVFLLIVNAVFAQQNNQKSWSVDSDVYKDMVSLYILEGHALPYSTGPWSTDELKGMLGLFDGDFKTDSSRMIYERIHEELYKDARHKFTDDLSANLKFSFVPEFYIHTNSEEFNKEDDWNWNYNKRSAPLNFDYEIWAARNFYFASEMSIGNDDGIRYAGDANALYEPKFMFNIPIANGVSADYINFNTPVKAFTSFGGEHWNVLLGRDVMRWGNGETGNLYLGGNQVYDNAIKFSTYFGKFKYTFLTNFSAHEKSALFNDGQNDSENGTRLFMAHRFDFRFLNDRLNFSVEEGYVYQNAQNTFDLRYFNPMMFFHNQYIRANSNSILGFEVDFAVCKGLNVYGQYVIDEFSLLGEPNADSENGWRPDKTGALVGVKYVLPLKAGVLKLNLEGVYTDPYLYLREQYDADSESNGVSLYSYNREFHNSNPTVTYTRKCIGYRYGGDCIVGDFKANFTTAKNWNSEFELFYMAHGIIYNDFVGDDWIYGKASKSPSTHDIAEIVKDDDDNIIPSKNPDGYAEHTFRVSLSSSYPVLKWLTVSGGIDNFFIWNKDNVKKDMVYDMQFHAGVKIYY